MDIQQHVVHSIRASQEGAINLLEQLVNINTYTANVAGVNEAQNVVHDHLLALGMQVERISMPTRGDVIVARSVVSAENPILLIGHIDTVHPPESRFHSFSRTVDRAMGPGCLDMKSGLVVMLWVLKILHSHDALKDIPVVAIINSDEEVGSDESCMIIEREAKKARSALVFEWGRLRDGIIMRRKGVCMFDLEVKGKAAHSGNNHQAGANAIVQLSHTILKLSALTNYSNGTTVNIGMISGGTSRNTVPELAQAIVEFRVENQIDFDRIKSEVANIIQEIVVPGTCITLSERAVLRPMIETPASVALFESYQRFASQAGLCYERLPDILGGGSDANRTSSAGAPSIDGLGPFGEYPHSDREYILLQSLPKKMINLALWLLSQRKAGA